MDAAARFQLIVALMAVVIALELLARRLRMPPAAAFILGGAALALYPGTPDFQLEPDLAMQLFLPPLLLASAFFTVWRDFLRDIRIILQLAVGAVAFTTLAVGAVAHLVQPSLPWAACFALGAIVAPPDAVAAKAVLATARLPRRMNVLLEGESLVNDATGLVFYRFAVVAALTGAFNAWDAAASFAVLSAGGVLFGLAFGVAASALLARLRDPVLSTLGSFLAAWASYGAGEALHVSGVLATVACGIVMGQQQHTLMTAATRTGARAVWDVVVFAMESLVFILIGLSLRGVVGRLGNGWHDVHLYLPAIAAIVGAVIVSRFMWILPATYVTRALFPGLRRRDPYPPIAVPLILGWAGMRGVVSLAAALALPEGFPGRDFILATTFAVILVTVLVQGGTLAPLIRAARLAGFAQTGPVLLDEAQARARAAAAQLAAVDRLASGPDGSPLHPRLLEQYAYRARAATRYSQAAGALEPARRAHFGVVLAAVGAARSELLRLHRAGEIHDETLHAIEHELDLEELSASRYVPEE